MATDVVTKLSDLMASQTERNASEFEMYVSARLEGRAFQGGMLDALGLNEVFSICAHLGRAADLVSDRLDGLSDTDLHRVYAEGFRTFSGGRATLSHALMELLEHKSDKLPPVVGPQNLIGKAHAVLKADSIRKRPTHPCTMMSPMPFTT